MKIRDRAAPAGAIAKLRDTFSASGRKLLQRIFPSSASGRAAVTIGQSLAELAHALLSVRGEASGTAIATDLLDIYERSSQKEKREFFDLLSQTFNVDEQALIRSWNQYRAEGATALPDLAKAVEAPRQELFRRLNLAPRGTAALVRMRADLLAIKDGAPLLRAVDADLGHLLQSWFNRGFLSMRSIDWSSPANLLERIIRYEAVHDITSWAELRLRLEPQDRHCFGFFHPSMPDEPLIFVEVALTSETPDSIQALLDPHRAPIERSAATTATFYSISNCQPGLRGISFGHFLIKQVAVDLKRELPNLEKFVTLSPVPGLLNWISSSVLSSDTSTMIDRLSSLEALSHDDGTLREFLLGQAIAYFTRAKTADGRPRDSVARFHLGNGARLERLNWLGDTSSKGLKQSGGLMVNYCYDLTAIEENHEAFAERGEIVTGPAFQAQQSQQAGAAV